MEEKTSRIWSLNLFVGLNFCNVFLSIPVAERSKSWVCGRSPAGMAGSNFAGGMVICLLCVLSPRGLCDGLIIHAEESYRLWCVLVSVIM